MAFRSGGNNRRSGGNFGGGFGGRNMNPWDQGGFGGGMRQGGGPMNADALSLANNLLNNLLRNQNPPSLLDLPRGGGSMSGNRNRGQMGNRAGGNRSGNRRQGSGFGGGGGGGGNRGNQKSGGNNKGGIRKQNAFDRAKKLLAKNSNKKKDSADKSENKSLSKESIYADVPNDMFYCHLCKKHMWDSNSFENHIKGRTHLMMREGIEESYRLKANMIRQEAKIAEQLKAIELDRLKRIGKSGKAMARDYCTMCDLNFHGHMTSHRKTEGHLALKKFLHPKCVECNKEFSTRIEFDTHLLTPDHLKKAAEKNTKVGERKKANLVILTEEEETKDVRPPAKKKKKPETKKAEGEKTDEEKKENGEETAEGGEGDDDVKKEHVEGEENKDADMNETKEEEEEEEVTLAEDPADCILDYHDGDEVPIEIEARLPKYNWLRPVGISLIHKLECFECQLCAKFFDTEKTAEIHTRTVSHHRQFTKFLNEKSSDTKIAQKRAAAAIEESERKRRRIEEAAAAAQKEENGEKEEDENAEGGDGDLYDPSEATGDEDVDMNNDANGGTSEVKTEPNGQLEEEKQEEMETEEPEVKAEPEPEPEQQEPEPEPEIAEPEKVKSPAKGAAAKTPAAKTPAKSTPRGKQRGRGRYNY